MSDAPIDTTGGFVPPPGAEPNMVWQGQLYSRSTAAAALAAFDADADRVKAAIGGDVKYQQERRDLWMMSRGHQPGVEPTMPVDAGGVREQMNERDQQIADARLDVWQKHIRMDDVARAQVKRGLATQQQVDDAKREIQRMLADKSFGARVLAGDMDAKQKWAAMNLVASMKVAPPDYDWSKDRF